MFLFCCCDATTHAFNRRVRVIYYFHSEAIPLYLITLFGKNEQSNLSKAERNELGDLVEILLGIWTEK